MGDRQVPPSAATMNSRCFQQLDEGYDEEYGGFAEAPKFPTPGQCPPCLSSPKPGLQISVLNNDLLTPGWSLTSCSPDWPMTS